MSNRLLWEIMHIEDALELVLTVGRKELQLIEDDCKNGTTEEYEEFKEALELIESIVLKSIESIDKTELGDING